MSKSIYPCLWFDNKASEAAQFYCSVFNHGKILADTPMVTTFEIEGFKIMGLNGGPMFTINPSISFMVTCRSKEEINDTWAKLTEGGSTMMAPDKYPWSEWYGWGADKYGMTWQLILGEVPQGGQKITPTFLFTGEQYGRAKEAIELYTTIFPNSQVHSLELYKEGNGHKEGSLMFGSFDIDGQLLNAMDGPGNHQFQFNEGVSLVVDCDTQQEIDHFWNKLTEGGKEVQCGWLKDKFGVSWQIIPKVLGALMSNPATAGKTTAAFMKMKKFDIAELEKAANS